MTSSPTMYLVKVKINGTSHVHHSPLTQKKTPTPHLVKQHHRLYTNQVDNKVSDRSAPIQCFLSGPCYLSQLHNFLKPCCCFAPLIAKNHNTMKFIASLLLAAVSTVAAFVPSQKNAIVPRTKSVEMGLWGEPNPKDGESGDRSQALPFAPRPKLLDGTLAGDVGFE
jgi:hypothetical protein